jgi:hypothetical protein
VAAEMTVRWAEVLDSPCPHGGKLGGCPEAWCRCRVEDFTERGGFLPARLASPGDPGGRFTVGDIEMPRAMGVLPDGRVLFAQLPGPGPFGT